MDGALHEDQTSDPQNPNKSWAGLMAIGQEWWPLAILVLKMKTEKIPKKNWLATLARTVKLWAQ